MIKKCAFIARNLSAPLWIYAALLGTAIACCLLYAGLKDEVGKNISLSFFSSLTGILITAVCIDFTANRRRAKETYEIRKAILIRCNFILYHIIDLWSELVECTLKKYNNENIFTEKFYKLVNENVDMNCCGPETFMPIINLYDTKRINIISLINNWIKTYASYSDPILIAILSKIELCNMMHYNAYQESIDKSSEWPQYLFSDQPPAYSPLRFKLSWDKVKSDFSLFKDFEERLKKLNQEFIWQKAEDTPHIYSLDKPIFKKFTSHLQTPPYSYNPYCDVAKRYDMQSDKQDLERIKELISALMKSQGVSIPKTRAQSLVDALWEGHQKEQTSPKKPEEK